MVAKKVVFYSYYSPEELTGIGKYNKEMVLWLVSQGFEVISFTNAPFYPKWKLYDGFYNRLYSKKYLKKIIDIRTWVYIPNSPSSTRKIISELTYFLTSSLALLINVRHIRKADSMIIVCPPFFIGGFALVIAKLFELKTIQHVQDLQVDAARELNLLSPKLCNILEFFESKILRSSDYVSTISKGMKRKLSSRKLKEEVLLLPNWSDLENIRPQKSTKWLHDYLEVERDKLLVVYSGNIGEKQGLEVIIDCAEKVREETSIHFVILGEGLYKVRLGEFIKKRNLQNISLGSLVPKKRLNDMLNDSFIQLVIQKGSAVDSFLPSKLTNIMAAGCAGIVTASEGTSLFEIIKESNGALIVPPGDAQALYMGIVHLVKNNDVCQNYRNKARRWAEANLGIDHALKPLTSILN